VTDIAGNIEMYLALLRLVRSLAANPDLVPLLSNTDQPVSRALSHLQICLTDYKIYLPYGIIYSVTLLFLFSSAHLFSLLIIERLKMEPQLMRASQLEKWRLF